MLAEPGAPPFPKVVDVEAGDVHQHPDLLDRLYRAEMHAIRVRGAFPPRCVAAVVARLDSGSFGVRSAAAPPEGEPVQLFGLPLQWAQPDLADYLQTAARFRGACSLLWDGLDYEGRIRALLGATSQGRPVEPMRAAGGEPYAISTIRRVSAGGSIPPHIENEQLRFPGCAELGGAIDGSAVMSFFTLLSAAESGGRLVLHAMTADDLARVPAAAAGQAPLQQELARYCSAEIDVAAGDTLLVNSGRFFHAVTPVQGERHRWTIGGFFAVSRGGDRVLFWA